MLDREHPARTRPGRLRNPGALLALAVLLGPATGSAQLRTERLIHQLTTPVYVTAPAGDPDRLFIVEQPGVIRILRAGALLPRPFLDIQALVNDGDVEQGMLGLTFHPSYGQNGALYVYYIGGTGTGVSRLHRYTVSADPDSADAGSAFPILEIDQPFLHHNGGQIDFGPDGLLYWGLGDGGGSGDPGNRAQDLGSLLGKMLRIDVDGDDFPSDSLRNYAIPATNPFVADSTARDEIWASGFRNPYRWSFDRLTGDLWIGDVGEAAREEIDFEAAGGSGGRNYGWRRMEGSQCFNPATGCNPGSLVLPVHEYDHSGAGCESVTGGRVYRGAAIPFLQGHYFFADYCNDLIWSFRYEGGAVVELTDRTAELDPPTSWLITEIAAFGEDGNGELYIVDRGSGGNGEIYKVVADTSALGAASPAAGPAGPRLSPPRPNPLSRSTAFRFEGEPGTAARISVHSADGRLVRLLRERAAGGPQTIHWDGRATDGHPVPAGVYFIRAGTARGVLSRSVVVVR